MLSFDPSVYFLVAFEGSDSIQITLRLSVHSSVCVCARVCVYVSVTTTLVMFSSRALL